MLLSADAVNVTVARTAFASCVFDATAVALNAAAGVVNVADVCRLRSWFKPHNPGLTAAEALTSPFFTYHYDEDFTPNI